jgi:hypothetical protein
VSRNPQLGYSALHMGSARELLQNSVDSLKKQSAHRTQISRIVQPFVSVFGGPIRLSTSPEELRPEESLVTVAPLLKQVAGKFTRPLARPDVSINQGASTLRLIPIGPSATYAGVVAGPRTGTEADPSLRQLGPAPQPLRAFPGFPGQRAPQNQNAPLGTGRLQTTKLGASFAMLARVRLYETDRKSRQWNELGFWPNNERCARASECSVKTKWCAH